MAYQSQPINFMKNYLLYFVISLAVILPGIFSLFNWGLTPAIDFTGGSLLEFQFSDAAPATEEIRQAIPADIEVASIQTTSNNSYIIRTKPIDKDQNELLKSQLSEVFGEVNGIEI
jgi:preprotein translocase subunit SecF